MNILELSEQEIARRNSLSELRALGIDPYPAAEYPTNAFSDEIIANFKDDDAPREVCIAGRMMGRRVMGKASFLELLDSRGRIQVYITRDDICPEEDKTLYNSVVKKLLDLGDFVGVKGFVFRTKTGEVSVHAREITVLAKSLKPLPTPKEKDGVVYDAFEDPELRYRRRYVDLIVNPQVKDTFYKRAKPSAPCVPFSTKRATRKWKPPRSKTFPAVLRRAPSSRISMHSTSRCIAASPRNSTSSA